MKLAIYFFILLFLSISRNSFAQNKPTWSFGLNASFFMKYDSDVNKGDNKEYFNRNYNYSFYEIQIVRSIISRPRFNWEIGLNIQKIDENWSDFATTYEENIGSVHNPNYQEFSYVDKPDRSFSFLNFRTLHKLQFNLQPFRNHPQFIEGQFSFAFIYFSKSKIYGSNDDIWGYNSAFTEDELNKYFDLNAQLSLGLSYKIGLLTQENRNNLFGSISLNKEVLHYRIKQTFGSYWSIGLMYRFGKAPKIDKV